jgi:internalin A
MPLRNALKRHLVFGVAAALCASPARAELVSACRAAGNLAEAPRHTVDSAMRSLSLEAPRDCDALEAALSRGDAALSVASSSAALDLTPLAGTRGVERLAVTCSGDLGAASLDAIASLSGLTDLTIETSRFAARACEVASPAFLASMTSLERLRLRYLGLTDLAPLASLSALTELDVTGNRVSRVTPLATLIGLRVLDLSSNHVEDLNDLMGLVNLKSLKVNNYLAVPSDHQSTLHNVDVARLMVNLTELELDNNCVHDLFPLMNLTWLERLSLNHNAISYVRPLTMLPRLKSLRLRDNMIASMRYGFLAGETLEELDIGFNPQLRLPSFMMFPKLKVLSVARTDNGDLSMIADLRQLTELDVSYTDFSYGNVLQHFPQLTRLNVACSRVQGLAGAAASGAPLKELKVGHACRGSFDLRSLSGLMSLEVLEITGLERVGGFPPPDRLPKLREILSVPYRGFAHTPCPSGPWRCTHDYFPDHVDWERRYEPGYAGIAPGPGFLPAIDPNGRCRFDR